MRYVLTLLVFKVFTLISQPLLNVSLSVTPVNSFSSDTIKIIAQITGGSYFSKNSSVGTIDTINHEINIQTCFNMYIESTYTIKYDTFLVGKLQPGNYIVNYTATPNFNQCSTNTHTTYAQTSFSVTNVNSLPEQTMQVNKHVYPNPFNQELIIESIYAKSKIGLFNYLGERIMHEELGAGSFKIATNNLPPGIYVLEFQGGENREIIRLVKE